MKSLAFAIALAALAQPVMAAESPLLVKSNYPGFTHPDWVLTETCEIFSNRVVISRGFGSGEASFGAVETRSLTLSGDIAQVIIKAAAEDVKETDNGLCDGPSTSISAVQQGGDVVSNLVLFSTGGCGSPRLEREGAASNSLVSFVNHYCPTTYDFGIVD